MATKPKVGQIATTRPRFEEVSGDGVQFNGVNFYDDTPMPVAAVEPAGRTWGEAATDLGAGVLQGTLGVARLGARAGDALTYRQGDENPAIKFLNEYGDAVDMQKSEKLRGEEHKSQQAVAEAGKSAQERYGDGLGGKVARFGAEFGTGAYEAVSNPTLLANSLAEQIPMMGAMKAGQKAAELFAKGATRVAPGAMATSVGKRIAGNAGLGGAVATGMALQGSDVKGETYKRMMELPLDMWRQNPEFVALSKSIGEDAAKIEIAGRESSTAGLQSAGTSLATSFLPGGTAMERALVGGKKIPIAAVPQAIAGEFAQEGTEEGTGRLAGNNAVSKINTKQDMLDGVGGAAGQGGAVGGILGGGSTLARVGLQNYGNKQTPVDPAIAAAQALADQQAATRKAAVVAAHAAAATPNSPIARAAAAANPLTPEEAWAKAQELDAQAELDEANGVAPAGAGVAPAVPADGAIADTQKQIDAGLAKAAQDKATQRAAAGQPADADPMQNAANDVVMLNGKASISLVQRHLKVGYNRAARLVEQMEADGIVGQLQADGSRAVLKGPHSDPKGGSTGTQFTNILDTDAVYAGWSNTQDGTDRPGMRDQMEYVARTYGPLATQDNRDELKKDLSKQFKWFRAAPPAQQDGAMDALVAHQNADPTIQESLQVQPAPAFDAQAAQEQYRADTLAAQKAQDDELNAQAEAALAKMAQRKQQTRPVNEVVSDGGYLYEGTQDGDVLNGLGKPFTIKMGALQEAKRQERENGGDWTVAPVFDGYVARKSATNKAVEPVESAQAATKNVAGDEVERYQWQRNAEGGQERGNQQTIQPLTEALFNEYIAPKVAVKSYRDYQQQFPAATHISLVQKSDGSVELGAGGVGPIDHLRPKAAPVEKGWVKAVDSFDSPEAVAHASAADSGALSEIDQAAHEAATSPLNDKPQPTDGQKEAGNYAKGHITVHGMDMAIENPKGSTRSGVSPDGTAWSNTMGGHYGYFKGTLGNDGDHVDGYVGPNPESNRVFVIDQVNKDGSFDEHKAMIGYDSPEQAREAYMSSFMPGWTGLGAMTELPVSAFKSWVADGVKKKPLGDISRPQPAEPVSQPQEQPSAQTAKTITPTAGREKTEKDSAVGDVNTLLGSGVSGSFNESGDSASMDAEVVSNLFRDQTLLSKGFDGLDAEVQAAVMRHMLRISHNLQVLNSVVNLIPVDVVNNLAGRKLTPEMLFHNPSMLKYRGVGGSGNDTVPIGIDAATSVVRVVASVTAKNPAIFEFGHSGGLPVDASSTDNARVHSPVDVVRGIPSHVDGSMLGSTDPVAVSIGGSQNQGRVPSDGGTAKTTIDGKHVVTPNSDDVLGTVGGETPSVPPTVSKYSDSVKQTEPQQQEGARADAEHATESGEPAADPAGASPSEVDLTTVDGVARAVQLKVASNRRKSREKSRKERDAKGYAPNSTPESEQADYEAEISAPPSDMQKQSAAAMLGTDPLPLIGMFVNGNFEASEDVFKAITGVKIRGLSEAAKKAALYQWAKWTPEQIAQAEGDAQARKDEAAEKHRQDDLKSAVTGAWLGLDRLKVNLKSGDTITGQDFVLQSVSGGFDKAHSQKKGAAVIYGLTDGARFTTLKAPEFTKFVKASIAFGGLDKALAYVNPPKPQAPEGFVDRSIDTADSRKADPAPVEQAPQAEPAAPAPEADALGGFDPVAFDKERDDRIKASREAGNVHLDKVPPYVESMRGKQIYYAHDPKITGTIRTVDNRGTVYVNWNDAYSAEKELASPTQDGKKTVMQSGLGTSDLKDYVVGKPMAPAAEGSAPSKEPAPRPKNWDKNYGAASKIAEALGVALRGANGKMKKVPELVADIKALDVGGKPSPDGDGQHDELDSEMRAYEERATRIESTLANGGHVVGDQLRSNNGMGLMKLTPAELTRVPANKVREKPDPEKARVDASTNKPKVDTSAEPVQKPAESGQVDAPQIEWTRTRNVDRMGIALKAGFKESVAESLSKRSWSSLDVVVQEKLAEAMAEPQEKPSEPPPAPTGEDALYTSTAKLTQPYTLDDFIGNVDAGYRAHFDYAGADGRTLWIERVEGGWVLKSKDDDSTTTITKGGAGAGWRWSKAQALREAENDAKYRYTEWKPVAGVMFQSSGEKAAITAGFKYLTNDHTWVKTVAAGEKRSELFNIREFGPENDRSYRVTKATSFPGTGATGSPSVDLGTFKTLDVAVEAAEKAQTTPTNKAGATSSSPAIQDFLDGKRDDAPTIEEVKAEASPLVQAMNFLMELQARQDANGRFEDDRLAQTIRQQKAVVKELQDAANKPADTPSKDPSNTVKSPAIEAEPIDAEDRAVLDAAKAKIEELDSKIERHEALLDCLK